MYSFFLVFDLTRLSTFRSIENWIKIIKDNTSPYFFILIENKNDLTVLRAVDKDIVLEFFMEISAKNNTNIGKMFKEVAYLLYIDIKKKKKERLRLLMKGEILLICKSKKIIKREKKKVNGAHNLNLLF